MWGNVLWTDREGWLSSRSTFRSSARTSSSCCVCYLDRAGNQGSIVRQSLDLPLALKAEARYISELVVPGFFKAWIWIRNEASLHPGEGQTHMLAWRSHYWYTLWTIHCWPISLAIFFGKTDFSQPSTHSVQTLLANCFPTHTKKDTNDHDWTSTQAGEYWYAAVDILSARWLITKRAWQQMMQQISYRKVEFTTAKENYPWWMHAGGSNFSAAAKQYPWHGAVRTSHHESSGNLSLCGRHELYWHNVFMKNHQERNRCNVSSFPDSAKTFWSDKKITKNHLWR